MGQPHPADFVFNIKAFSLLTGHPTAARPSPRTCSTRSPPSTATRSASTPPTCRPTAGEVWRRFRDALLPLDSAGKLGAVLLQYPEWFTPRRSSREELPAVRDRLGGYQVCVEFRNAAWLATDRDRDRTLGLLRDHDLPLVCVDMPQGFRSSVPPSPKRPPPPSRSSASTAATPRPGRRRRSPNASATSTPRRNWPNGSPRSATWPTPPARSTSS